MRWPSLLAFCGAAVCVSLFTHWIGSFARRRGLVNRNEARTQLGYRPVPRMGGVAIALGFALTVSIVNLIASRGGSAGVLANPLIWLAAAIVFSIGLFDDLKPLPAQLKLAAVLIGGALVAIAGYRIENVPFLDIPLGRLSGILATSLWFGVIVTAWNFIDGLDGLASVITIVASLALWFGGLGTEVHIPAVLAGAAFGFLVHNRYPSSIFMGDSGSFFLGFWIALSGIVASHGGHTSGSSMAVLVALAWPLADLGWALLRRAARARMFQASGDHLHYALNARLGHRNAVLTALTLVGASGVVSVLLHCHVVAAATMAALVLCLLAFCARVRLARPVVLLVMALGSWLIRDAVAQPHAPPVDRRVNLPH